MIDGVRGVESSRRELTVDCRSVSGRGKLGGETKRRDFDVQGWKKLFRYSDDHLTRRHVSI